MATHLIAYLYSADLETLQEVKLLYLRGNIATSRRVCCLYHLFRLHSITVLPSKSQFFCLCLVRVTSTHLSLRCAGDLGLPLQDMGAVHVLARHVPPTDAYKTHPPPLNSPTNSLTLFSTFSHSQSQQNTTSHRVSRSLPHSTNQYPTLLPLRSLHLKKPSKLILHTCLQSLTLPSTRNPAQAARSPAGFTRLL